MKQYIMRSAAALVAALCWCKVGLAAVESTTVSGIVWHYAVEGDTISIVGADDFEPTIDGTTSGGVSVPAKINGTNVVSIGEYAFWGCKNLTGIVLPDSISSIGEGAFFGCSGLKAIRIPSAVESIGILAFKGCANLATVYHDNGYLTQTQTCMSDSGFDTTGATFVETVDDGTGIEIVDGVEYTFSTFNGEATIGLPDEVQMSRIDTERAAIDPSTAGAITIPSVLGGSRVTAIGTYAFWKCTNLTAVVIQEGVRSVVGSAFSDCTSLSSISFPTGIENVSCGCIYNTPFYTALPDGYIVFGKTLYTHKGTQPSSLVIPEGVELISEYAFAGFKSSSISFPSTLRKIGCCAFRNCSNIRSVVIPEGVTSVDTGAFMDNNKMESITFPSTITHIGSGICDWWSPFVGSFTNGVYIYGSVLYRVRGECPEAFVIPENIRSIADGAFSSCTNLKTIVFNEHETEIADSAFRRCTGLKHVNVPETVTTLGAAFWECAGLESVNVRGDITALESYTFSGCTSLTSVQLPSSIRKIERYAFGGCASLTSIDLPQSVRIMDDEVFANCTNLQQVQLPVKLHSIGQGAFYKCSSLASIEFPAAVTRLSKKKEKTPAWLEFSLFSVS